jgi:hypothetical protein
MTTTELYTRSDRSRYGFGTNPTLGTTFTERGSTSTRPTAITNESCMGSAPNHVRLKVYTSASGGTVNVRVIGWNPVTVPATTPGGQPTEVWEPTTLYEGAATAHTVSATTNGGTLYPQISVSTNMGAANSATVDGTGYKAPGHVTVDLKGAMLYEVGLTASSSPTANVHIVEF